MEQDARVSRVELACRALLRVLYPPSFRAVYAPHIIQIVRDCVLEVRRERGVTAVIGLWCRTLGDVLVSGLRLRAKALWGLVRRRHHKRGGRRRRGDGIMTFFQDLRYAMRALFIKPGLACAVVLIVALGVGANTAVFSVVKVVLLEPLPYESPEQLVGVWEADRRTSQAPVAGPNFLDWREQNRVFESMGTFSHGGANLTGGGEPEHVLAAQVTPGVFEVLRASPALGRTFLPEEEEPGNSGVAVISDGLWRRRLAADPDVLNKSIVVDGEPRAVVGVMPPGFEIPSPWLIGQKADVWFPLPVTRLREERDSHWLLVIARLKDGVTWQAADREMDAIHTRLAEQYPASSAGETASVSPLHEQLVGRVGEQLMMLLGAAGFVLLIVCANVAGLLTARATARRSELAIRTALGASRGRLIRQLLTESLPLTLFGGLGGLLLAVWGVGVLRAIIPSNIPRVEEISVDGGVLGFTLTISLLTGLAFGIVPALMGCQTSITDSLQDGRGRSPTAPSKNHARSILVVCQFALTLVLANGAALMLKSYLQLRNMDLGFDSKNVLTMELSATGPNYDDEGQARVTFYRSTLERVRALPGVSHVGFVSKLPLHGGTNRWVQLEGQPLDSIPARRPLVEYSVLTPGYLEAMGIPLLAGRHLGDRDTASTQRGVIVNQAMVRRLWPDEDPIGKRFRFIGDPDAWNTVVGVVADVRQWGLERSAIAEAYVPYTESSRRRMYLVIHTEVEPLSVVAAVRREAFAIDEDLPVYAVRTMEQVVNGVMARRRFNTLLTGIFAAIALVLVAAGIYGVMAFYVVQRFHEIGVRLALGANRASVMKLVVGRACGLAGAGIAVGLLGVFATTNLTASMLYGVSPTDFPTVVGGILFMMVIALLGSYLPAHRATTVDPVAVLRSE